MDKATGSKTKRQEGLARAARFVCAALCLFWALGLGLPLAARADEVINLGSLTPGNYTGWDYDVTTGGAVTITAAGTYNLSGTTTTAEVVVNATGDVVLNLNGVNIESSSWTSPLGIEAGNVTVNLTAGTQNTLTATLTAGLRVAPGAGLVINGPADATETSGALVAKSSGAAGIGGGRSATPGSITINGGHVTATGGNHAAGIGGGGGHGLNWGGGGGVITISGGHVTATGDVHAAGIGGGGGDGTGGGGGAGGVITISGGHVTATSGTYGAAIGGGGCGSANVGGAGGLITISGGAVVQATGSSGNGIGGGGFDVVIAGDAGTIVITGAGTKVTAQTKGAIDGIAVGGAAGTGSLEVSDGATLDMQKTVDTAFYTTIPNPNYTAPGIVQHNSAQVWPTAKINMATPGAVSGVQLWFDVDPNPVAYTPGTEVPIPLGAKKMYLTMGLPHHLYQVGDWTGAAYSFAFGHTDGSLEAELLAIAGTEYLGAGEDTLTLVKPTAGTADITPQSHTRQNGAGAAPAVYTVDRDRTDLEGVYVGGRLLEENVDFTVANGSTILTLKDTFIANLAAGSYDVEMVYMDDPTATPITYSVETATLVITSPYTPTGASPRTGDMANTGAWLVLAVLAMAGLVALAKHRRAKGGAR